MLKQFARIGVRLAATAALLSPLSLAAQSCPDCIFGQGFENQFVVPANDAEAARFLNQATFGATRADIGNLRSIGYENFVDTQLGRAPTLARPALEARAAQQRALNLNINQDDRIHLWFNTAVTAPDQVRQKVAYALSQMIVTSDQNDSLNGEPIQMAEWNDIHVRNAMGNYRDLLREVSFSPMMGKYLTHLRNRKYEVTPRCRPNNMPAGTPTGCETDTTAPFIITPDNSLVNGVPRAPGGYEIGNNGNEPDENYAREIMQLFSVGLVTRNADFSVVDDPGNPGNPLPTYDQAMIRTLSRAFTGLAYDCSGTQTVQGVVIQQNCSGTRNSAPPATPTCTGIDCRFLNLNNLYFNDPPRSQLPNASGDSSVVHPDFYRPLVCYPRYNDTGRDRRRFQLPDQVLTPPVNTTYDAGVAPPSGAQGADKNLVLSGTQLQTLEEFRAGDSKETVPDCESTSLTATTQPQRLECINYCENNVRSVADLLFNHPNTAPMVARQLILHLVTSNPSPQYIARVAGVFADNGAGVRGDLRAVTRAILLDTEARQPFAGQFGKPREPLMKLVAVWRNFGATSADARRWGPTNPQTAYLQRPHGAPSVFNFYEPDYQQPGPIANAGLYSPEFQIINENFAMQAANDLFGRICTGWNGQTNGNCGATGGNPVFVAPTDRAFIAPAQINALPGMSCASLAQGCAGTDDVALIEELNIRMLGGLMSGAIPNPTSCSSNSGMKGTLHNLLRCGLAGTLGQTGTAPTPAVAARQRKALYLIHLIAISPEYAHQR